MLTPHVDGMLPTILTSYRVPGWSYRSGPGVFPFLCLPFHTFQNSRGHAGHTLLFDVVHMDLNYMFRYKIIKEIKYLETNML